MWRVERGAIRRYAYWREVIVTLVRQSTVSERFGFLGIFGSLEGDSGLRGGLMVIDDRGMPLEIRVSTPVKPWRIQRAVYGRSLALHVVSELVATPLLGSLEFHPRFVLTNHLYCLEADSRFPVLLLRLASEMAVASELQTEDIEAPNAAEPLILAQKAGAQSIASQEVASTLSRVAVHFDPLEVFARINAAMDVLAESDEQFR